VVAALRANDDYSGQHEIALNRDLPVVQSTRVELVIVQNMLIGTRRGPPWVII